MSVGPVQPGSAGIERPTLEKKTHAEVPVAGTESDPGKSAKAEIGSAQNSTNQILFPEHEVKVQEDTPEDHILVYQVLDKQTGALVLQVPSSEVLNDVHRSQELLQRIDLRGKTPASGAAPAPAGKGEENPNGSKL